MGYCTRADVVALLPSGGLPNPARVATGSASGDYIDCDQHALAADQAVTFRAESGGSVPAPLVEGTTYYAKIVSTSRFQVAATAGGTAISLTTDGVNFNVWSELPWDAWINWASSEIDGFLPEHMVPVAAPYERRLVTATAELAAKKGLSATAGAAIDLGDTIRLIGESIARWAKGLPVRGLTRQVHQPPNLAITASAGATDPRGWAGTDPTRIP